MCSGLAILAVAQESQPQDRPSKPAETKLVGVNILDTGMSILSRFGSPDQIQALTVGSGGVGPGGGFGGGGAAGGGGAMASGVAGGGPGSSADARWYGDPFGFQTPIDQQRAGAGPGAVGGKNLPGVGGPGGAGGAAGGSSTADANRILYTRWVYKRGASRYAFVLDKFNRVVQIEAVGLGDARVGTSRGIHFGSSFADVVRAYNVPDAYEISGDSIVVRYLVRDHVAFRLSRLKAKEPHKVTGIVVAAGKA